MKTIKIKIFSGLFVALFLSVLIVISCNDNKHTVTATTVAEDSSGMHKNNSTVSEYIAFVRNDRNKMTLDHTYTNEALLKLSSATSAMASEAGFDVKGDLEKVKESANKITHNPFETSHGNDIRKAADILASVLQNMQQAKFPGLSVEASEVVSAAGLINPDVLTLNQRDAVKSFFNKSADLLEKMN